MLGWKEHHVTTFLGAVAIFALDKWISGGGWQPTLGDVPMLSMLLVVLRAMYQTPPGK